MTGRKPALDRGRAILLLCGVAALGGSGSAALAQANDPKAGPPGAPTAEAVLRRSADFYKNARSIAVEVERAQKIGALAVQVTYEVAFQRPNRFAVRTKGGGPGPGIDVVCDGKKLFVSIPALKKYTEGDAPASIDALGGDMIVQSAFQGMLISEICAADPYGKLMEGVKTATYAGLDELDGAKAHHLKFTQDQFDWETWVAAEGDPVIRRVVMDLTKAIANSPAAEQLKNQKLEMVQTFKDWRVDRGLDEKAFTFQPPEGAQKVKSFMEGIAGAGLGQAAPSPLLGKPAPDVSLKRLDGGEFRLKDYRDERVVVLDFWATWCGPCVQEMPILAEVAEAYKDKGVVFCAVNQQEKPEPVRKFLEEKKLKIPVALDAEGATGNAYQVAAIPTLVLIDKKGVVQSVHVGYDPEIKATLGKELDTVLAGKDLPREAPRDPKVAEKAEGLEPAWTVSGPYTSLAAAPKGRSVYAVQRQGRCDVLDPDGNTARTFRLAGSQTLARAARLADGSEGLLGFDTWGQSLLASNGDGTKLWEESGGQGIDDVWAADLDGDGVDEVIVGYNGTTGLHVFSADGKRLWKRTDMGNVWHVTAGDLDGDGKPEVVTTSAQGKVHVFAPADGQPLRTLDAGLYANMVRTAPGGSIPASKGDVVLVVGSGTSGESMAALGGDVKTQWTLKLPSDARHCDSLAVSPDGAWAAAGLRGGRVCVVDVAGGRVVAQVAGQGTTPMVAWTTRGDEKAPLLLVATGREVNAFRVKPVAAAPENGRP
jgi:thiol-disulfide isomerase/thioredoxin